MSSDSLSAPGPRRRSAIACVASRLFAPKMARDAFVKAAVAEIGDVEADLPRAISKRPRRPSFQHLDIADAVLEADDVAPVAAVLRDLGRGFGRVRALDREAR